MFVHSLPSSGRPFTDPEKALWWEYANEFSDFIYEKWFCMELDLVTEALDLC